MYRATHQSNSVHRKSSVNIASQYFLSPLLCKLLCIMGSKLKITFVFLIIFSVTSTFDKRIVCHMPWLSQWACKTQTWPLSSVHFVDQVTIFCSKVLPSTSCDSSYFNRNWSDSMAVSIVFSSSPPTLGAFGTPHQAIPFSRWLCQGRPGWTACVLSLPLVLHQTLWVFSPYPFPPHGKPQECIPPAPSHLAPDSSTPCQDSSTSWHHSSPFSLALYRLIAFFHQLILLELGSKLSADQGHFAQWNKCHLSSGASTNVLLNCWLGLHMRYYSTIVLCWWV